MQPALRFGGTTIKAGVLTRVARYSVEAEPQARAYTDRLLQFAQSSTLRLSLAALGGRFSVEGPADGGTLVVADIPIPD
jgi:hypothetical protein